MNWYIILAMIGFCAGYLFGLTKNKELDKKYFLEYKKDMQILTGYQPNKYGYSQKSKEIIPPKRGSNAVYDDLIKKNEKEAKYD